jgi:hypothetical protein
MDGEGMGELAIERHLAQIEQVRRARTAAVRIGRRKFADHAGRRILLVLIIDQAETIAVSDKSVAHRIAGHVQNPHPAYRTGSPQRTRHPLRVDLERTRSQEIHRRIPPCSDARTRLLAVFLLAGDGPANRAGHRLWHRWAAAAS